MSRCRGQGCPKHMSLDDLTPVAQHWFDDTRRQNRTEFSVVFRRVK